MPHQIVILPPPEAMRYRAEASQTRLVTCVTSRQTSHSQVDEDEGEDEDEDEDEESRRISRRSLSGCR